MESAEHLIHQESSILTTSGSTCHQKMQITNQGKKGSLFSMENYLHSEPSIWQTLAQQCFIVKQECNRIEKIENKEGRNN